VILIVVILFMPQGLLGRWSRKRRRAGAAPPAPAHNPQPTAAAAGTAGSTAVPAPEALTAQPAAATSHASHAGDVLLEAVGVAKSFSGVRALDGVDLQVRAGEILGLVGPNGSGKSTMINVVSGHYRASAGRILWHGEDLVGREAHLVARAGISRTYQIPRPFAHLSVLENVALPAMFGRDALRRAAAEREARRWLQFTGLDAKADALPDELNLHQRKFLELARALAARPSLLFLDEVLSGLTPTEIDDAIRLIRAIRDQGATIVFVEHVMRAVMELTDRVVVLSYGRVIGQGRPAEVMNRPEVVAAYLGTPSV